MSFWDASHGIVIGDSVAGKFYILTTSNGGRDWSRVPADSLPPAKPICRLGARVPARRTPCGRVCRA
jgi:photosystem II stability/assembly factor-like uncharacterized protein